MGRLREDALESANRNLRMIQSSAAAFAKADATEFLFIATCELAVEVGGYDACWIGLAQENPEQTVDIVASSGRGRDYIEELRLSWADNLQGRGPTGTSIREGRIVTWSDIKTDPLFEPWRDKAAAIGFRASIAIPFRTDGGTVRGAFVLYSGNPMAFKEEQQDLLMELADNLSEALNIIITKRERDAALEARTMSEERCERLLSATGTVLYTLTLREKHAYQIEISQNVVDVIGYSPKDIQGSDWWLGRVHPDDLMQAKLGIPRVCEIGHYTHRYRVKHHNGDYRWVRDDMTRNCSPPNLIDSRLRRENFA
ncbi:MAG: hypothetical protein B7Z67_14260 [Acidiphilium sp. 21-60-14]|nr:MAG: hypothetical protein B7Z67_14260 [Acidiphilium sp. 21-60-14]OYW05581.1 MAG: hypothetical protein B7Z59_13550 [Acidiphilium sp. 37-67-22]